jgi:hypothetical protein
MPSGGLSLTGFTVATPDLPALLFARHRLQHSHAPSLLTLHRLSARAPIVYLSTLAWLLL